jgi:hypothetical protein
MSAMTYEFTSPSPNLHPVCIARAGLFEQDAARKAGKLRRRKNYENDIQEDGRRSELAAGGRIADGYRSCSMHQHRDAAEG